MYSIKKLHDEIRVIICGLMEIEAKLNPDWITQSVMRDHLLIDGQDIDFYSCCTRALVRGEVTKEINDQVDKSKPDTQMLFEGFVHLQQYYVIKRQGNLVGIRIDQMTSDELQRKAAEHYAMGNAHISHGDEILRYDSKQKATGS